jgi:hypothetical protein
MWQAVLQTQQLKNHLLRSPNSSTALTWVERGSNTDAVGPSNGNTRANNAVASGRIDAILVDNVDPAGKTVFIGGDMGGLWKTNDITASPATWTLINDFMGNLVVSAIAQDPVNSNIMYFSTGEGYYGGELGIGVFKSIDHGVSWNLLPSTAAYTKSTKLLCDNIGNVYLATTLNGLRRSSDGGITWIDITPSGLSNRICDLELSSTGRMHVCVGISGTTQDYRYTDIPSTVTATSGWTAPSTTFVTGTQRAEIAVSGNTLYALPCVSNQVPIIYKSVDGGNIWNSTIGQPTNGWASGQGWYALTAAINPTNPDQCIIGGLDNYKTTDGGITWSKISTWFGTAGQYVHADQHTSIWYDNGNKFLFGCDGGIFYSSDGGNTSRDRNAGLRLKQFYSCAIHPSSTNYFLAGAQDNGTHQFNGAGLTSSIEVTGGDGAYVDIDQDQPQYQFGAYIYNQYRRSSDGGASWSSINFSNSAGQFINPFDYDDAGNRMYCSYLAGQYLRWEDPQTGNTFTPVPITSFGGASAFGITVSPYTANRVYFGTTNGRVVQVDAAETATPIETIISGSGMPTGSVTVNSISVGSSDQNIVACYSNFGVTNVWVTADGGATWSGCDGNLPNVPVYSAVFHPDANTKMVIATETGVWETEALNGASTVWTPSPNFPTVRTSMLRYRNSDRTLLASTYGRGLWTTNFPSGCTAAAITTQPLNAAICAGGNATFTLTATGTSFQWQQSINGGGVWTNITNGGIYSGATTTTLNLTGVTALMNTYQHRCVVTGSCAPLTATSNAGVLTVNAATIISSQPAATTICANTNTAFNVIATGTAIIYQWQLSTDGGTTFNNIANGGIYSNVTTATLNITGANAAMNNYRYRCVLNSSCGLQNSNAAVLTVNSLPVITNQPANTAVCTGNTVTFIVTATGTGLTYQWQQSIDGGITFNNIGGANTASYSFISSLVQNGYQFRCIVGGTCTPVATSAAATLSVGNSLVINNQPVNTTACTGGTATYTIAVSGTVTYQWQESTNGGTTYTNIANGAIYSGATTATLQLTGVTETANNNLYRCTISGSCPSISSNGALLTVNTLPSLLTQPSATSVICAAQNTSFTVVASGTAITYQWQLSTDGGATFTNLANGGVYSNATTATINITGATAAMNNYRYRCIVSGACTPAIQSNVSVLTVNTPVTLLANPANSIICENSNTSFAINVTGTLPAYQWQVSADGGATFSNIINGGIYTGASTAALGLTGVTYSLNNKQYRCIITGAAGCTVVNSNAGTLSVNAAPAAFALTGGGSYCAGGTGVAIGLNNSAIGFNYQLKLNGINTGTALAGTGTVLNFGNKLSIGTYTVTATNNATGCTLALPGSVSIVINPLPTVTLAAAPYQKLFPGLVTTLTAVVNSTASPITYLWYKDGNNITNTANTFAVTVSNSGTYKVAVTDANGCVNQSQLVSIADSSNSKLFIYPSPNNGQFSVVYYNTSNTSVKRMVTIFSSKGEKVYHNEFTVSQPYQLLNIDLRRNGADVYYVILTDENGKKLKTGEVVVR